MKYEIRCQVCGKILEYTIPSAYPGTNEPTLIVEACCLAEEAQDNLNTAKEQLADLDMDSFDEDRKYVALIKKEYEEFLDELGNADDMETITTMLEEAPSFNFEFEELTRSANFFEELVKDLKYYLEVK